MAVSVLYIVLQPPVTEEESVKTSRDSNKHKHQHLKK